MNLTIAPLPQTFLDRVRTHGIDDQNQPVRRVVAEGGEPCRDVLRRAEPGEELLLASFTPFTVAGPYKEFGPIFVLANDSGEPARLRENYLRERFVIRAYSAAEEIVDAALTEAAELAGTVERFFASDATAFLHVRFPAYGCFAMRIDRT
jgi:hypothetical protein